MLPSETPTGTGVVQSQDFSVVDIVVLVVDGSCVVIVVDSSVVVAAVIVEVVVSSVVLDVVEGS